MSVVDANDLTTKLLESNLIVQAQLEKAEQMASGEGVAVTEALIKLGFVPRETVAILAAEACDTPYIDLTEYDINLENRDLVSEDLVRRHKVFPLFVIDNVVTLAMADPSNLMAIDQVRLCCRREVETCLCDELQLLRLIDRAYNSWVSDETEEDDPLDMVVGTDASLLLDDDSPEHAPVVKLVNIILSQAVADAASDVHIEPEEKELRVRFRVDGILHEIPGPPIKLHPSIVARIKVLSNLDIAETRRPQDGQFKMKISGNTIEFRVSTLPTIYGENVVLRVLNSSTASVDLHTLGLTDRDLETWQGLLKLPYGMLLVTGPTGSGKTTTLYATLSQINTPEKKIVTVEDPVEYRQPYIRQVQINPAAGVTFATGLRSILRQDPDVLMVGEIRDSETAQMAVQAALTGHMVFSTLHTNDAPTAVVRLREMGVLDYLISSSVTAVVAQRLARRVCNDCAEPYQPREALLAAMRTRETGDRFRKGAGCKKCRGTGYRGRLGLYELMVMSDTLRQLTNQGVSAEILCEAAKKGGMRELIDDGVIKAGLGMSTLEEVLRVAGQGAAVDESLAEGEADKKNA